MKKNFILTIGIITLSIFSSYTFSYNQEQTEAYQWAYQNKIISQPNIQDANLNGMVTRQSFSKMVVSYIENVVLIPGDVSDLCSFSDEDIIINDLKYYSKRICAYKIMGQNRSVFKPTQLINRAQLGTVLSRVLRGDEYDLSGDGYYVNHINALKNAGIMNNIENVIGTPAKRGDVLIMLKRINDKFGSGIYLNSGVQTTTIPVSVQTNTTPVSTQTTTTTTPDQTTTTTTGQIAPTQTSSQPVTTEKVENSEKNSNNDYVSNMYSNANVIYTGSDGTIYYYDDKFLKFLGKAAKNKGESDLANYLKVETEYFKNGLDQLSNLDDEELLKSIGIDINTINPNNMTNEEKENLINNFKAGFGKIVIENKDRNNKFLKDLGTLLKDLKNDKFGLIEKYKNTKIFMAASNQFLDKYSESIYSLMEIALMNDISSTSEGVDETFGLVGIAETYQKEADKYQKYIEEWAVKTIKSLGIN